MPNKIKRIAIVTSGGDAPGMNAAIRAITRQAFYKGLDVVGVKEGYKGLIENNLMQLSLRSVSGIINRGGTMLQTVRCPEIKTKSGFDRALSTISRRGIDALVVLGGDGSLKGAERFSAAGVPVNCIPASIDNDIYGTDETIGFDTALNTAVEAIDKIRDTATSHKRVFIVEVMGREHGFLSLQVGISSGAEIILIPEVGYRFKSVASQLKEYHRKGKSSLIIIFAEGLGDPYVLAGQIEKGGIAEARVSSLGYIQRGGSPSARSRFLACCFGAEAVDLLVKGVSGKLICLKGKKVDTISLSEASHHEKKLNMDLYALAKRLAS